MNEDDTFAALKKWSYEDAAKWWDDEDLMDIEEQMKNLIKITGWDFPALNREWQKRRFLNDRG